MNEKLSVLIREGAILHPQHQRELFLKNSGNIVATCALGAACVATWYRDPPEDRLEYPILARLFEVLQLNLYRTSVQCPLRGIEVAMCDAIVYLNDDALWSREAIADWLESLGY